MLYFNRCRYGMKKTWIFAFRGGNWGMADVHDQTAQVDPEVESKSGEPCETCAAIARQAVLIVDDSQTDLRIVSRLLEAPDRRLVTASSGEEALQLLPDYDFALIILDVHMDGMSGFETAEKIRANEQTQAVPIIFVTATDRGEEAIFRGYDMGAVDYLFKPVEANLLRSKVNVFCQLSAQRLLIHQQLEEIQAKNEVLKRQLGEIQTLRGLVPICAKCKNVRDDSGFWQSIEYYVSEHSEAEFSHSLCPQCRDILYPGL